MSNKVVKLTVVTDFTCLSCCVGEHELLNAISHCQEAELPLSFEIEHIPFQLICSGALSDADSGKYQKEEFLGKRLGEEKFTKLKSAILKWADEKGVPISFRGCMSQSTRAHRLCQKAFQLGGQSYQVPLICAIFKAHMEEGKDIADINVLSDLAAHNKVMSKDQAIAFLNSNELEAEVHAMCKEARTNGVSAVPMVIIDGKWAVKGGQSSDVFVQIFKKLAYCGVHSAPSPFAGPVIDTQPMNTMVA
ncbi:thioredoxin-like protein [Crepidotus variabilis]|uniref:Thioredoxin-like protein n=1 Tax=Crepidotus variabilis TaxID=179855 RepID=A0A9P6ERE6_9AGAR|nr:thioredoxin-like protein [Crepidotus variabilis]